MGFVFILIGHWLAETISEAESKNKPFDIKRHVGIYGFILMFFSLICFQSLGLAIVFVAVNVVMHIFTDLALVKYCGNHYQRIDRSYPVIELDNLLHIIVLYITYFFLIGSAP